MKAGAAYNFNVAKVKQTRAEFIFKVAEIKPAESKLKVAKV